MREVSKADAPAPRQTRPLYYLLRIPQVPQLEAPSQDRSGCLNGLSLRANFPIDESKLRCRVGRRWDQNYERLTRYWSNITAIPARSFFQSKPDPRTRGKPTLRKEYHGVCVVYYLDVNVQYELQAIGEAMMEMVEQRGIEPLTPTMPSWCSPS